jgi:hypothetical protein
MKTELEKPEETGKNKDILKEIEQALDSLEFVDAPPLLTVKQWIEFTQKYGPKWVNDPRRARPL